MTKYQIVKRKFRLGDSGLQGTIPMILSELPIELQDKVKAAPKPSEFIKSGWYEEGGLAISPNGSPIITSIVYVKKVNKLLKNSEVYRISDDIEVGFRL